MIAGCGADLFINICLTLLGYFPGRKSFPLLLLLLSPFLYLLQSMALTRKTTDIHAFYLEFVYFDRRDKGRLGQIGTNRAPGVYSENVQRGGTTTYGTVTN